MQVQLHHDFLRVSRTERYPTLLPSRGRKEGKAAANVDQHDKKKHLNKRVVKVQRNKSSSRFQMIKRQASRIVCFTAMITMHPRWKKSNPHLRHVSDPAGQRHREERTG
jgi:hypothetical protein